MGIRGYYRFWLNVCLTSISQSKTNELVIWHAYYNLILIQSNNLDSNSGTAFSTLTYI